MGRKDTRVGGKKRVRNDFPRSLVSGVLLFCLFFGCRGGVLRYQLVVLLFGSGNSLYISLVQVGRTIYRT